MVCCLFTVVCDPLGLRGCVVGQVCLIDVLGLVGLVVCGLFANASCWVLDLLVGFCCFDCLQDLFCFVRWVVVCFW